MISSAYICVWCIGGSVFLLIHNDHSPIKCSVDFCISIVFCEIECAISSSIIHFNSNCPSATSDVQFKSVLCYFTRIFHTHFILSFNNSLEWPTFVCVPHWHAFNLVTECQINFSFPFECAVFIELSLLAGFFNTDYYDMQFVCRRKKILSILSFVPIMEHIV